ncbi:hypothetical protein N0V82_005548 [Gnomoniopsis sp. IMI 355080]|nr:hypothetical protein N0V82_005548 [Gnomoniopsis sp. IMI 355080]
MGDAAIYDTPDKSPVKFPKGWTVFARNFEATFGYTLEMGVERDHPLFAVRIHSNFSVFGRPALVLHLGPNKDGPRLGVVKDATLNPTRTHDFDIFLPPVGSGMLDNDDGKNVKIEVRAHMLELFPVHRFSVMVGQGRVESFEWRHTVGKEVSDLVGGTAAGWTLVRMGAAGQTDDGREVVAVWAAGYQSKKEAMKFRFLSSGASDELGDMFESAAVVSALGMWDHVRRARQKNPDHGGQSMISL